MKRWQRFGLVLIGFVAWSAPLEAQTTLRYKFKEGDKFAYALDQKMKMSTNVMGKDIELNMGQAMEMSWQVLSLKSNGDAAVKLNFTAMKMTMDGPGPRSRLIPRTRRQLTTPKAKSWTRLSAPSPRWK